jgi:2-methylisocitrate lyase-like PEP mutase family enzyme
MTAQTEALQALVKGGRPFIAADCYSALTARVVEQAGFPAAYMGGHATGMMHYAVPDCGLLTTTEMVDQAGRVAASISIPLIVDADQVGESVADVFRTIRRYEQAGVAGVHMEDEINPKHSSFDGPLTPIADMQARIAAAVDARTDPAFLVIARCDEMYNEGGGGSGSVDETIRRGVAYADAGADAFLPTFASAADIARIADEVPCPIAAYGKLEPGLTFSLFTGWGTASAVRAHQQWARHLFEHGDLPAEAFAFEGKDDLIDQAFYDGIIRTWAERTVRPTR